MLIRSSTRYPLAAAMPVLLCLFGIAATSNPSAAQQPARAVVGDPTNPSALPDALQAAYASGARTLVIQPGLYTFPPTDGPLFRLKSWSGVTIIANNTTLIISEDRTRSRGILLKGDNGVIRGNTFTNLGMSAVSLGPEYYWGESAYVHNVVVENNFFDHCGVFGWGGGCVLLHGDGAVGNENIRIANNHFLNDLQANVEIDWTDGAVVTGNRFAGALPWPLGISQSNLISLDHCQNVTLANNPVRNSGVVKANLVGIGIGVTNLTNNYGFVRNSGQ